MSEETVFSQLVSEYLEHHTAGEMADEMGCAISTVDRWCEGITAPHPAMQQVVVRYINKMRQEEGW